MYNTTKNNEQNQKGSADWFYVGSSCLMGVLCAKTSRDCSGVRNVWIWKKLLHIFYHLSAFRSNQLTKYFSAPWLSASRARPIGIMIEQKRPHILEAVWGVWRLRKNRYSCQFLYTSAYFDSESTEPTEHFSAEYPVPCRRLSLDALIEGKSGWFRRKWIWVLANVFSSRTSVSRPIMVSIRQKSTVCLRKKNVH